jgi:hypothetical protein
MQTSQANGGFGRRLFNGVFNSGLALATVTGFWLGLAAAYVAAQFQTVAGLAAPEPQALPVAELLAKGPGKNLHVQLTDLAFGKPLIEEEENQWKTVWVPVLPAGRAGKPAERAVYLRAYVTDQSQLDELLGRKSLTVLVASSLPDTCLWKPRAEDADGLKKADERVLAAKAFLVREPDLPLGPLGTLPFSTALDGNAVTVAWVVSGVALSAGFFFLLLVCTARPLGGGAGAPEPLGAGTEYEYGRLVNEIPQSEHVMPAGVLRGRMIRRIVLAAVLLLVSLVFVGPVPSTLAGPRPQSAIGFVTISAIFFFLTVLIVQGARGVSARAVTAVSVCHTGLRLWSGDRVRLALWADIASVNTREVEYQVRGQGGSRGGTTWMKLRCGEAMTFRSGDLTDWVVFARHLHANVNAHNGQVASQGMRPEFRGGSFLPRRG